MYLFLDFLFLVFHASLILFILTGWLWRKARRLHLVITSLTCLSWFGLGWFFGLGYCPCTDWHWRIKRALGQTDLPTSYVNYYLDQLTGRSWDPILVGSTVMAVGVAIFGLSVALNWRDTH